jgi:hypothetical protein
MLVGPAKMVHLQCCVLINNAQTHTAAYQLVKPFLAVLSVAPPWLELEVMSVLPQAVLLMNVVVNIALVLFAPLQAMC